MQSHFSPFRPEWLRVSEAEQPFANQDNGRCSQRDEMATPRPGPRRCGTRSERTRVDAFIDDHEGGGPEQLSDGHARLVARQLADPPMSSFCSGWSVRLRDNGLVSTGGATRAGTGLSRLFADDYSSTGQRAWLEGARGVGADFWEDDFRGQLRFDSLLARTLVIPDSHVFDGSYFLRTTPQALVDQLGRAGLGHRAVGALEIRGRETSLEASLAGFLRRPGKPTLNAFVFKSLDASLRHRLAAELKKTSEPELDRALQVARDVPAGVAGLLKACLGRIDPALDAEAIIAPLEEGWRRWLHDGHLVEVKKWPTFRSFDIKSEITKEGSIDRNMRTELGRETMEAVRLTMDGSEHRSDISEVLAQARGALPSEDEGVLNDLDLIDAWYSRLRYRALAARHGCTCSLTDRPWLPAVGPAQALFREALRRDEPTAVPLPEGVLTALGDLEEAQFVEFVRRHRRDLVRWWETKEVDDLHRVADGLADLGLQRDRPSVGLVQTLPAAGSAAGAALGGLGGPVGGLIGSASKAALERRRSDSERLRLRVLEAIEDRVSGTR